MWVRSSSFWALAMPKSVTRIRRSVEIMMLAGLMSRCTMPARWASSRASAICTPTSTTSVGGSTATSFNTARSVRPSISSMTMASMPPSLTVSYTATIDGCDNRAEATASRRNRATKASSVARWGWRTLTATGRTSATS